MTSLPADALKTAYDLGQRAAVPIDMDDGGRTVFAPAGTVRIDIKPTEEKLTRIRQEPTFHDRDSFIAYVNRFKTSASQCFAEPGFLASGGAKVKAYLDYHDGPGKPDYRAHVATYMPRYSEQWTRWTRACSAQLKQAEFAEFIEEVRADIQQPAAASLLDIVRTFKASKKVEFDSVVYQPNGDIKLAYDDRTEQKGTSGALPEQMMLGIPVYFRGAAYAVPVFIRYRVGSGAVTFQMKLDRADVIEDAAFNDIAKYIGEQTALPVYLGNAGR